MHSLWCTAPWTCEVRSGEDAEAKEGQVVVRTEWSGVSRGTESLVARGGVPLSEYERMRGPHMQGTFDFPVKYGYSCVGIIENGPRKGSRVFCLHPHQDRFVVDSSEARDVPFETPSRRAVLAPNMETAVNIVWDAGISIGDRVCVVGGGVVGLLVAYLSARTAGSCSLYDPQDRSGQCRALGIQTLREKNEDQFDVVVHVSANPEGLRHALALAGDEAVVVEASWYGDRDCTLSLGHAFHSRRLTIKSSQVGRVPPSRAPRWDYSRRMALALQLCKDDALDCLLEEKILHFFSPDFTDDYIAALKGSSGDDDNTKTTTTTGLCVTISYGDRAPK